MIDALRNVLVNTAVDGVHPDTRTESATEISRIRGDSPRQHPTKAQVEEIWDTWVSDVLMRLQEPSNQRATEQDHSQERLPAPSSRSRSMQRRNPGPVHSNRLLPARTSTAGSQIGPMSELLGAPRRTQESLYRSLRSPQGRMAPRTSKGNVVSCPLRWPKKPREMNPTRMFRATLLLRLSGRAQLWDRRRFFRRLSNA